ncbi:DUF6950 family protein [Sphingomonas sp. PAMC 26605]|uniref:DUF6950 family protein n=1 Tax=Sphingomonas sp. PAMC 26605 TaxID=1112214 RepID=UPI0012F52368|nr:hypothetical protein [Sphingomonas sp. PAMC 26605]
MIARQQAAQATVDRFKDRPFAYGKDDCVRLAAFVLRKRGHRPQLGKAGGYSSLIGARRALKRAGYETLAGALDALGLARIAPAGVLPADIVMVASDVFDGGLGVVVGNGRVIGWHEDSDKAEICHPLSFVGAWRT